MHDDTRLRSHRNPYRQLKLSQILVRLMQLYLEALVGIQLCILSKPRLGTDAKDCPLQVSSLSRQSIQPMQSLTGKTRQMAIDCNTNQPPLGFQNQIVRQTWKGRQQAHKGSKLCHFPNPELASSLDCMK